jgi:hypothetical protein
LELLRNLACELVANVRNGWKADTSYGTDVAWIGGSMWWKLGLLFVATGFLILLVIPLRSHAVSYDPVKGQAPSPPTLIDMLGAMHLTATSVILIAAILAVSGFVAFKVIRGHW